MNIFRKLFLKDYKRWREAQIAEKNCWRDLWAGENSPEAEYQIKHEKTKNHFLIKKWEESLGISFSELTTNKFVLDVGCGPTSYVAENVKSSQREGIDPLEYPAWVYQRYEKLNFRVHKVPFEKFKSANIYDLLIFYNALQHFCNLKDTAISAFKICKPNGKIMICEYLDIPSDDAHIHVLKKSQLDDYFSEAGFEVTSKSKSVRLAGLVEKGSGEPVDIYTAILTKC